MPSIIKCLLDDSFAEALSCTCILEDPSSDATSVGGDSSDAVDSWHCRSAWSRLLLSCIHPDDIVQQALAAVARIGNAVTSWTFSEGDTFATEVIRAVTDAPRLR